MSTVIDPVEATMAFVKAFDGWLQRVSVANAGESVTRLRLLYELHCNGPRKMTDLADTLGVTPRNVTALVDGLEAEGLLRRTDHPTDRRVTIIELTGGGETVEGQFDVLRATVAGLFDGIDDRDRDAFLRVLGILTTRIDAPG
jgi:DNA-binding MarR family transcriptional regulator